MSDELPRELFVIMENDTPVGVCSDQETASESCADRKRFIDEYIAHYGGRENHYWFVRVGTE